MEPVLCNEYPDQRCIYVIARYDDQSKLWEAPSKIGTLNRGNILGRLNALKRQTNLELCARRVWPLPRSVGRREDVPAEVYRRLDHARIKPRGIEIPPERRAHPAFQWARQPPSDEWYDVQPDDAVRTVTEVLKDFEGGVIVPSPTR